MKHRYFPGFSALFALSLLFAPAASAGDIPPPGSRPLSSILSAVEAQKLGSISEAEFDDGRWEVKVCQAGACQKLYIDPRTGKETRRRKTDSDDVPPPNAIPLSKIVQSVEARGLGIITEVEFDDGYWEVELRKDGRKIKLVLDPLTGEARRN
jgi:hypothetical protein